VSLTISQTTFPRRLEDNPTFRNWPGENMKVVYGEGLYIGYRHYESMKIAPLFPFGHGLSYTTFTYGTPTISSKILFEPDRLTVTIPITNSGSVECAEIVQAYIHDEKSRLPRPEKELQAFDKVFLKPGETKNATLTLDKYSVGYYDTDIPAWIAEEGVFNVLIGASSADIRYVLGTAFPQPVFTDHTNKNSRATTSFEVKKSFTWIV
jgi:beta-glucosidase